MIPPSSLARLVVGYLEEEGLQHTVQSFYQEYNDNLLDQPRDPFAQTPNLKSILEDYVALKESVLNNCPEDVVPSLWKNLDVLIGQLKYHTIANPKSMKPQKHAKRKGYNYTYTLQPPKPKTKQVTKGNSTLSNSTRMASKPQNEAVGNHDTLQNRVQPVQSVFVAGIHVPEPPPNRQTVSIASSNIGASVVSPIRNIASNHASGMTTSAPPPAEVTRNTARQIITSNSSVVHTTPSTCESCVTLQSGAAAFTGSVVDRNVQGIIDTGSVEGVEMFSKSPKRKGNPPKKRHAPNLSPAKALFGDMSLADSIDLQQLLDSHNDATMPLLLDTFLNTPLLQEKLAENINKVVGSSKPMEVQEVAITETVGTSMTVDDVGKVDQHTEVPVDDILCLLEADPVFESFFSMLATDASKLGLSPTKDANSFPTCTVSGLPPSTSSTTSNVTSTCSQEEQSAATSLVTESLLLLASSPSKLSTSTSVTCTLQNTAPLVTSKPLTPEKHDKVESLGSSQPRTDCEMHVRSLHFSNKETLPEGQLEQPKKARPGRPKKYAVATTSTEKKRCPKKTKKKAVFTAHRKVLLPNFSAPPIQPAVNMLQSLASSHRVVPTLGGSASLDGRNSNGIRKMGGNTMLQLLQDAAAVQQIHGNCHESDNLLVNNPLLIPQGKNYARDVVASNTRVGSALHSNELVRIGQGLKPGNQHHAMSSHFSGMPYANTSMQQQLNAVAQMSLLSAAQPSYNAANFIYTGQLSAPMQTTPMMATPIQTTLMTTTPMHITPTQTMPMQNARPERLLSIDQLLEPRSLSLNTFSSASNFSAYGFNSFNSPLPNASSQASGAINSLQADNSLASCATNTLPAHVVPSKKTYERDNVGNSEQGHQGLRSVENTSKCTNKTLHQIIIPEQTSGQSSDESSPISPNAEDCVSSFCQISELGKTPRQENIASKSNPLVQVEKSVPLLKSKHKKNIDVKKANKEEALISSDAHCGVDKTVDHKASLEGNQPSPALSCHSTDSAASAEERRQRTQGVKRHGISDLKENKPKRSKGSRISKKSKRKKDLPKNFDVEKFLSRLHYVEK